MSRKLFCEICPFTYRLSMEKEILKRRLNDLVQRILFATQRTEEQLPVLIYRHNSLIRRRLGNVNMQLQENKATNLALAVKHIDGLLIHPGETFSIWQLIGRTTKRKGYKEGLTIAKGQPSQGIGGSSQTLVVRYLSEQAPVFPITTSIIASRTIHRTHTNSVSK